VSGSADEAKGRVKEALGELTDDEDLKREGKLDKATGKVKDKVDEATRKVKDKVDEVKDKVNELTDES
jgi:uncharacterized protein YjbJ (UPF0337 family)